ncbi:MAG: hypothetical protein HC778_08320 [Chamaesiphon sp. CSU_1_12]|nr:hypothetical protein [Chamaesiphon sp. CSU_1_12]
MVARQMIFQLRHRNFILCYLGADSYAFVHRTFLEYFCAEEFVWQFEKDKTLTIDKLIAEVVSPHWQDETWHEVLQLICGSIEANFVAEIVEYLLDREIDRRAFLNEHNHQEKEGLSNIILAANCFEEVRNKQEISSIQALLMKALQKEIEHEHPYKLSSEAVSELIFLITIIGHSDLKTLQYLKERLELNTSSCVNDSSFSYVPPFIVIICRAKMEKRS